MGERTEFFTTAGAFQQPIRIVLKGLSLVRAQAWKIAISAKIQLLAPKPAQTRMTSLCKN
jgi:hypothetical protein